MRRLGGRKRKEICYNSVIISKIKCNQKIVFRGWEHGKPPVNPLMASTDVKSGEHFCLEGNE